MKTIDNTPPDDLAAAQDDPLLALNLLLKEATDSAEALAEVKGQLMEIARILRDFARPEASQFALVLAALAEIGGQFVALQQGSDETSPLIGFLQSGWEKLRGVLEEGDSKDDATEAELSRLSHEALDRWGDWLEIVSADEEAADGADEFDHPAATSVDERDDLSSNDDDEEASAESLDLLLSTLVGPDGALLNPELSGVETTDTEPPQKPSAQEPSAQEPSAQEPSAQKPSAPKPSAQEPSAQEPSALAQPALAEPGLQQPALDKRGPLAPPLPQTIDIDAELLEAFLDDGGRCLAGMEAAALALEQAPQHRGHLQQICRELHTLKGASASVELTNLATYLHDIEHALETAEGADCVSLVLAAVDTIRGQLASLSSDSSQSIAAPEPATASGMATPTSDSPTAASGGVSSSVESGGATVAPDSLRVAASRLDRLMDMLAELAMLRNRRSSRVSELQKSSDELIRCATRLRAMSRRQSDPACEVANDILEIARGQRELCGEAAEENLAVSRFIRQFRHELMDLRRLSISGLFRRLQRAVHDAARVEGKRVRLQLIGEHAGLERSLQERLYEPLLHIVRNAVGHGVETESQRVAQGKDPVGTIILEARGGLNLLTLEVRDDGRGLDYDVLRRRGMELGLIDAHHPASREQLAQLIFHPGFSTRKETNEISGRGVGMDVVAASIDKMRGWIELESTPGEGTKFRLSIPLRSVIEHTMVFRTAGQLFALPMQSLRSDGSALSADPSVSSEAERNLPTAYFGELINAGHKQPDQTQRILLGNGPHAASAPEHLARPQRFSLLVDEIIGPEEVVVRPLPALLRGQRLATGVTLSGSGELMLLLDSQELVDQAVGHASSATPVSEPAPSLPADFSQLRVLVVDDSLSVRRSLVRSLRRRGMQTVEAADGREALDLSRHSRFDAVFTDLEMPRMGGLDLLRELRRERETERIPVVVVSTRDEAEFQDRARELGAAKYLTKPVVENLLSDTLCELGFTTALKGTTGDE